MRVACLIDSLGSGGAERQLSELAMGLRDRGHVVEVCHYHGERADNSFYETQLLDHGVAVTRFASRGRVDRLARVRGWLQRFRPDVVQAYLSGAGAVAVLSSVGSTAWRVVVSERIDVDYAGRSGIRAKAIAQLYRWADWVVTNSHSNRCALVQFVPALAKKSCVIWNCVDLERFSPVATPRRDLRSPYRFLCVASMGSRKNSQRLIAALGRVKAATSRPFTLRWVGRCNEELADHRDNMAATQRLIEECGLVDAVSFRGQVENVEAEYRSADALILVSTREGLPNVICEAMASGLPIVAGAVADVGRVVREGASGFLCDPWDVGDIARAVLKCMAMEPSAAAQCSARARETAERFFEKGAFVSSYEQLYDAVLCGRRAPTDPSEAGATREG